MQELPSGTVTFLFTDIEGSTQLWEHHPERMRRTLARHDGLVRRVIEQHGGTVFKTIGDAFCAAFPAAPDAVEVAIAAQQGLLSEADDIIGPLRVRMALHTGSVEVRDGDYFGPPLNRVARLLNTAHGGQIVLSLPTQELVRDQLPTDVWLEDLGEHRLKDLVRPERIAQVCHPMLPTRFPSLRSLVTSSHNLPVQSTHFLGRDVELLELQRLLGASRLVTLTGTGGVGKTRLALQIAGEQLDRYADGVWLVELAPLTDPGLVPHAVASVVGTREEPGRQLLDTLLQTLKGKHLLLLLDNCEHLLDASAHLTTALLRACPQVHLLATSREVLSVAGETTYRVPSLALPDPHRVLPVERLVNYAAVRLFVDRALAANPRFQVTYQNAGAVAQICRRLDGIPLALELAAARVRALSVETLAQRLDDRFRLLTGGSRAALPRQQTLRTLIDRSYDLLDEPERMLLRRLAVFAGGWTLEAAEAVCAGGTVKVIEVLDLLTRLVDKSLVLVEEVESEAGSGRERYRLLETIRQYSQERLVEAGEVGPLRARHLRYFADLVEAVASEVHGPDEPWELVGMSDDDCLQRELDNLRTALDWCLPEPRRPELGEAGAVMPAIAAEERTAARRLAAALTGYWGHRSLPREGTVWVDRALQNSPGARDETQARLLQGAGWLGWSESDFKRAVRQLEASLTLSRDLGATAIAIWALGGLGLIAVHQGQVARAAACLEEALALAQAANRPRETCWALFWLGYSAIRQQDAVRAQPFFETSLALRQRLGRGAPPGLIMFGLGVAARQQGDLGRAADLLEEAAERSRRRHDMGTLNVMIAELGAVLLAQGEVARAVAVGEEALAITRDVGDSDALARAIELIALLGLRLGETHRSIRLLGACAALREGAGIALSVVRSADDDRALEAVRVAMGEFDYDRAWIAGRALTVAEMIAEAHQLATELQVTS